jgi:hypothetical protein
LGTRVYIGYKPIFKKESFEMKILKKKIIIAIALVTMLFPMAALASNDTTVEGQTTYFSTGKAYADKTVIAGYNARDKKLYVNYDLVTDSVTNPVPAGEKATFNYYINVFDKDSVATGNLGTDASPLQETTAVDQNTVSVANKEITFADPLPHAFRIVITVKEVTFAP